VPLEADVPAAELAAQQRLACFGFGHVDLRRPLKGRLRLGHEGGDAGRDLAAAPPRRRDLGGQIGDAADIVRALAR
jgi:hypothetical protein